MSGYYDGYLANTWIGYAVGTGATGLTAWRNGDSALTAAAGGTVKSFCDQANIIELTGLFNEPEFELAGALGQGYDGTYLVPKSLQPAPLHCRHRVQAGFPIHWAAGVVATTDDTPTAGHYSHAVTKRVTASPPRLGFHVERGYTKQLAYDLLGLAVDDCTLEVQDPSLGDAVAYLDWNARAAYVKTAGTDLATPTALTDSIMTWANFKDNFTFTYAANPILVDILSASWKISNLDTTFEKYDSTYYASQCVMRRQQHEITLHVRPLDSGTTYNLFTLSHLNGQYAANALAFTMKGVRDAASDYISLALDKAVLMPMQEEIMVDGYEEYDIVLRKAPKNGSVAGGTFTSTIIDHYNDDYYENDDA